MSCTWCFVPPAYTLMTLISSLTLTTGTPSDRATRSAVRCLVPVSLVGTVGSGTRCTLARAIRVPSAARMIAPSIFASSLIRCGLYGASSRKPPLQMASTSGPSPSTTSAPIFARTTRSSPSRSGVPGATAASALWSASAAGPMAVMDRVYGTAAPAAAKASPSVAARISEMRLRRRSVSSPARSRGGSRAVPPR